MNNLLDINCIKTKQDSAKERLSLVPYPTIDDEDWKYFDFDSITKLGFDLRASQAKPERSFNKGELNKIIEKYAFKETLDNLLVTLNGEYLSELSNFDFSNPDLNVLNFDSGFDFVNNKAAAELIKKYFAKDIETENQYFKILNTIGLKNGFLLDLKDNTTIEKTVQILHISNQDSFNQVRSLIHLGKNSSLNLLVTYVGLENSKYFTNAVIECYLQANSQLSLTKIQNDSLQATRLYSFNAELERDSSLEFNSFSFGAKSSRDELNIDINGTNAKASINGLYVVNQDRQSHHKVVINHNREHSSSEQLFKGLLQGKAKAEFNGLIEVARDAQKTDAKQLNANLLLSRDAHIDSRPQLNILADDVKCSHGSTVGNLNPEELFYLISRGLSLADAQTILTYSFSQELIDKIHIESARNYASNLVFKRLSEDQVNSDNSRVVAELAGNSKFKQSRLND